jgi:hypothetical protein
VPCPDNKRPLSLLLVTFVIFLPKPLHDLCFSQKEKEIMKRLAVIFCVMCVLVQPLSQQGIYLMYQLNKAYIASELCEQRLIPDTDCQGKCHLRKELKKDAEREQQAQRQQQAAVDLIFYATTSAPVPAPVIPTSTRLVTHYQPGHSIMLVYSIFHPPQFIA